MSTNEPMETAVQDSASLPQPIVLRGRGTIGNLHRYFTYNIVF